MKFELPDVLLLAGAASITTGVGLWAGLAFALITAGLFMLGTGYLIELGKRAESDKDGDASG